MKSTENFYEGVARLRTALREAEAVVIGAGAGLSISAGFPYAGERFERHFADFIEAYGFTDMYTAGFYRFDSPEEHWGYWSRHIYYNRYDIDPGKVYADLRRSVARKDYFVITTNVDHLFQTAGFDPRRLFYTQGDYGLWQCSIPCHPKTYDNEAAVRQMIRLQTDRRIPTELVPKCPVCRAPMAMNLRIDATFVEDEGWKAAYRRYAEFIRRALGKKTLFWELGVGNNTPGIIRYPFWRMTKENSQSLSISVNTEAPVFPPSIRDRSFGIRADIGSVLAAL